MEGRSNVLELFIAHARQDGTGQKQRASWVKTKESKPVSH
jgi:hypothetical protein